MYIKAFALTYLGDYSIGIDDEKSISYLKKARDISIEQDYHKLLVRIFSLLGFYYDTKSDEQSSLEYYIEALSICHFIKDAANEALILNNIGYNLQRHRGYDQALKFYKEAYQLLTDCKEDTPIFGLLLNNLATVSILLNELEEAKRYIMEIENEALNFEQYDIFVSQTWCQYYAHIKESEQALIWADRIISREEKSDGNNQFTFDIYSILFDSMMELHNKEYSHKFLSLMIKCELCNAAQQQELEIQRMKYYFAFESDKDSLNKGYKQYVKQVQVLDVIRNKEVTNGLKDMIRFLAVTKQKEQLKNEKNNLADQVNIDELTMVFTRHYLDTLMNQVESEDYKRLGFIMIDVDCLKEYNDTYGHIYGDDVLRFVGNLLNKYKSNRVYPCRFGGDEFVCLCMNCSDEEITNYIESIRDELHLKNIPHKTSRCATQITLSIGYCNETKDIEIQTVFELADQALYHSKLQGRNSYSKQIAH